MGDVTPNRREGVAPKVPKRIGALAGYMVVGFDALDRFVMKPICILAVLAVTGIVCADAAARYFYDESIPHLADATGYLLMPIVVFLSLSFVNATRGHVSVDLLFEHLGDGIQRFLASFADLLVGVFLAAIAQQYFSEFSDAVIRWDSTSTVMLRECSDLIVALGCTLGATRMFVGIFAEVAGVPRTALEVKDALDIGAQASE